MNTVSTGTIQIGYKIYEHVGDYEQYKAVYEWVLDTGEGSEEWFPSAEEAIRDVESRYT